MSRWFSIMSIILFVAACTPRNERLPIDEPKLVAILVDVHLAEAAMQEMPSIIQDSVGRIYYNQIFRIHQVSEADFNKTIYLLKMNPAKMESVYKKVSETLDKKVEELH
ncbi:MAG: DUF4296 domain-containing protein [Saprospiraceae bacterium]|nr:DUF4296 domain-containing protein [Saprospiraceae bacterium]